MMDIVHIFISTGRFRSFDEIHLFIDETYSEDGDGIDSEFMAETGFAQYEPGCIEAVLSESGEAVPLKQLLDGTSYCEQWLLKLDITRLADAAICVFSPNEIEHPDQSSMEYLGKFHYQR
ncbi:MAG: hypothetical protein ACI92S_003910 [Planctomycetaceae bacterium]|jgi:hypothetical protein